MKGNKNNILRIIALLLITALVAGVFISCGEKKPDSSVEKNEDKKSDDSAADDNDPEEEKDIKIYPDLPEDIDYDGYVFTFLSHEEAATGWDWATPQPRECVAEVADAEDPINDAVYRRNTYIMDKYGVEFDLITNSNETSLLKKSVQAGDNNYDAVLIYNNNVPGVVTNDLLLEVSHLPYLDLEKPWWDKGVNAMSVAKKQYLLAGDLLILDNEATNAIIFNKDLMQSLGIDLPYNMVKEGKWTFDAMLEMCKGAELDLNGDGKLDYKDDRFSFVTFNDTLQAFLVAGGGTFAAKDSDDIPYMCFAEQKNLDVMDKAMNLLYKETNPGVLNVQKDAGSAAETWRILYYDGFMDNRALFMWIRMRVVEVFRGMDANFGILPMPKYDEAQDDYCSLVNPYTGVMMGVPKTAEPERTSIILEALSAESKYTLQPAYYDIVLSRKFTRDDESQDMLDIIFGNQIYDIGGVYSFGGVFSDFNGLASKEDRNIISYYDKKIGNMEKAIDKVVTAFETMDD